jgi:Flp pilus assembly protein TadG
MLRLLKKVRHNERGNVLILTAAAAPLLLGSAGLAVDTIQWTLWKRQLQRAADSAAIAAVYDYHTAGSESAARTAVTNDLVENKNTWVTLQSGFPQVAFPADNGQARRQVRVTLAVQQALPFSSIFMPTAPVISAQATAALVPGGGPACFQALENTAVTGITHNGNNAVIAPECVSYSNSTAANSASAGGSSNVELRAIATVGGVQQSRNWRVQQYLPYSPALPDRYASLDPTSGEMSGCSSAELTDDTTTIPSGVNCFSSLKVGSNKTLDLTGKISGPIFINGGDVDLKGTFTCDGCTIILTNSDSSPTATIGTLSSNASANNNINAPTTGKYAGIAIFQDRRASLQTIRINGGSGSVINGAVYMPSALIRINGNGSSDALCASFIGRRLEFIGTSAIRIGDPNSTACAAFNSGGAGAVSVVRLVA